ncbi:hypothetical protein WT10_32685 [Burkholderia stagnalis]|uniref:hypothetical protein n=1 Tax=Burkholderia stagnalis TaxID=1503054 RepID=UPI000757C796|nr:hypothetical protein [Burkholderia stagnalis]KVC68557.1 hypothetical protein WS59_08720 [Burkholderia stagnalis]KVN08504.1 hypothetical protein WT10_32685 [Burkholderia stagnalis]
MKLDKTGLLMVAGAALVLLAVVRKSTAAAGAPASGGQGGIGSGASSFWSNVVNNLGGSQVATTSATAGGQLLPGDVRVFANGTYEAGNMYVDPGQLTYNAQTGQVQESPFSGMYNILAPNTYGF